MRSANFPILLAPIFGAVAFLFVHLQTLLLWQILYRAVYWPGYGNMAALGKVLPWYFNSPLDVCVLAIVLFAGALLSAKTLRGKSIHILALFWLGTALCDFTISLNTPAYWAGDYHVLYPIFECFYTVPPVLLAWIVSFGISQSQTSRLRR